MVKGVKCEPSHKCQGRVASKAIFLDDVLCTYVRVKLKNVNAIIFPAKKCAPATQSLAASRTTRAMTTMTATKNDRLALAGSFVAGVAVSAVLFAWKRKSEKNRKNGVYFLWAE